MSEKTVPGTNFSALPIRPDLIDAAEANDGNGVQIELGLQESVRSAVLAGYGVTFISRSAVEQELAAGTLAEARVRGLNLVRDVSLVREVA